MFVNLVNYLVQLTAVEAQQRWVTSSTAVPRVVVYLNTKNML